VVRLEPFGIRQRLMTKRSLIDARISKHNLDVYKKVRSAEENGQVTNDSIANLTPG
jgi:hypothetical protein